ncbi:hypothetical protein HK100_000807 [Physocladia obscura]|uniref:Uncharacterized protein n=1 Tax=Physocladia obscura TaxID=109957 RepID=A0AAD5SY44_9FUNG|nr:hypothetical protein HK100_000807 [Physocladia obscura]
MSKTVTHRLIESSSSSLARSDLLKKEKVDRTKDSSTTLLCDDNDVNSESPARNSIGISFETTCIPDFADCIHQDTETASSLPNIYSPSSFSSLCLVNISAITTEVTNVIVKKTHTTTAATAPTAKTRKTTSKLYEISNHFASLAASSLFSKDIESALQNYTAAIEICLFPCSRTIAEFDRNANLPPSRNSPASHGPSLVTRLLRLVPPAVYNPVPPPPTLFVDRARARVAFGDFAGAVDDCDVVVNQVLNGVGVFSHHDYHCGGSSSCGDAIVAAAARWVRGIAAMGMGSYESAVNDFRVVLAAATRNMVDNVDDNAVYQIIFGVKHQRDTGALKPMPTQTNKNSNCKKKKLQKIIERKLRICVRFLAEKNADEAVTREITKHVKLYSNNEQQQSLLDGVEEKQQRVSVNYFTLSHDNDSDVERNNNSGNSDLRNAQQFFRTAQQIQLLFSSIITRISMFFVATAEQSDSLSSSYFSYSSSEWMPMSNEITDPDTIQNTNKLTKLLCLSKTTTATTSQNSTLHSGFSCPSQIFRHLGAIETLFSTTLSSSLHGIISPASIHIILPILAAIAHHNTLSFARSFRLTRLMHAFCAALTQLSSSSPQNHPAVITHTMQHAMRLLNVCFTNTSKEQEKEEEACIDTVVQECAATRESVCVWSMFLNTAIRMLVDLADEFEEEVSVLSLVPGGGTVIPRVVVDAFGVLRAVIRADFEYAGQQGDCCRCCCFEIDLDLLAVGLKRWIELCGECLNGNLVLGDACRILILLLDDGGSCSYRIHVEHLKRVIDFESLADILVNIQLTEDSILDIVEECIEILLK